MTTSGAVTATRKKGKENKKKKKCRKTRREKNKVKLKSTVAHPGVRREEK